LFVWGCAWEILPRGLYNYGRFLLLGLTLVGVVYYSRGASAVADLIRPLLRLRAAPKWYIAALIWGACVAMIVLIGKALFTSANFSDFELQLGVITQPRILLTIFISALIGEIVWISYSVKRLSQTWTLFTSALIVGFFWTAWWMPMAYFDYGIIPGLNPIALLINQTGVALMCALVYFHTRSAFLVLVMQMVFNSSILALPVLPTTGGEGTYLVFSIAYFTSAVLAFAYFGPAPRPGRKRATDQPIS
jgi:hypothetical protein